MSTLAEPAHQRLGVRSNDSINEYGEERYVFHGWNPTYYDYDFHKSYGCIFPHLFVGSII